ncbi:MAG: two-component system response regulator [Desulfitibacter sp. BRH_c19]|nr:MAG: two-component system response regulator [Desulfitibacter sp. BRH_c19]
MKEKILIVEDEHKIMKFIKANLLISKYEVFTAFDGNEALIMYDKHLPDIVLLDVMLPEIDGYQFLTKIRNFSEVPVILITAKNSTSDAIKGLELGADEYITKPFDIDILLARIKAVLRRSKNNWVENEPLIKVGNLCINLVSYKIEVNNQIVKLNPTELKLLTELAKNKGCMLTHEDLLTKVWGIEYKDETHYLRVCVARIRNKLNIYHGDAGYIETIPTIGYKMLS